MKRYGLATILIASCLVAGSAISQTAEKKLANFANKFDAPRVGKLSLEYVFDEDAEPVSTPAMFKISLKCADSRSEVLVQKIMGCELKSYQYAKETKILHAEMMFSVMDAASIAHCERREEIEIDLGKFCADQLDLKLKAKAKK